MKDGMVEIQVADQMVRIPEKNIRPRRDAFETLEDWIMPKITRDSDAPSPNRIFPDIAMPFFWTDTGTTITTARAIRVTDTTNGTVGVGGIIRMNS